MQKLSPNQGARLTSRGKESVFQIKENESAKARSKRSWRGSGSQAAKGLMGLSKNLGLLLRSMESY